MKTMRNLIQLCLLGVVLLVLSATVQAQFTFTTNNGSITITGYTGSNSVIVIPDTTNGYPVTSIGDNAFDSPNLTSVTIPGSITSIGDYAFYGCINLASLALPGSITNIGIGAFNSCWSLTNVEIPASVTSIGNSAFIYCTNLTAITVDVANPSYSSEDGVLFNKDQTILLQFPFGNAGSYAIPGSVTGLADGAFGIDDHGNPELYFPACPSLTNLIIPGSITNIADYAFADCVGLTSVSLASGIFSIGIDAFSHCKNLTSVTIPGSCINLGPGAFAGCSSLASVTIENGLTSIGDNAFNSCLGLPSIMIPASVTEIGTNAFFQCINLHSVYFMGNAPGSGNDTSVFGGNWDATAYYLPDKTGWESSFDGIPTIEEPYPSVFAYTVTNGAINITGYIGSDDTVVIPTTIGGLTVRSIGNFAFFSYSNLKSATISASVTNIETLAFASCYHLTSINVDTDNSVFSSINGVLFDKGQTSIIEYPAGLAGNYLIPSTVTSIGDYAFSGCGLSSVTIPNGVFSIGEGSFTECFGLRSVTIPNSVTNIGSFAFYQCTGLTNITIPNGVTNFGNEAFGDCDNLTGVYFEGNAPSFVGLDLFNNEPYLTVYYLPNTTGWEDFFTTTGVPIALWLPQLWTDLNLGVQTNQFGFNISWASGQTVVVEVCTNLSNPDWQPVQTNTLTGGTAYFSDPQWTNYPGRFYRLRSP